MLGLFATPFARLCVSAVLASLFLINDGSGAENEARLSGKIVDASSGELIPARITIESASGQWYHARSSSTAGSAVDYDKRRTEFSNEVHTTLSAHPFEVTLPQGDYTITVERGKEYKTAVKKIKIGDAPQSITIKLKRWINMAQAGWYSGDTHVHRPVANLPNIILAEDLNVALPLSSWVTAAYSPPSQGDKNIASDLTNELIQVDETHVIYPMNTEYEIFTVNGKRHPLGAIFVLNHQQPLTLGAPPVSPVAKAARSQNAILDLDKHSWPWSLMLIPIMDVDLFELTNNHVWRTEFAFKDWTIDMAPRYQHLDLTDEGFTEWSWIDFGFKTYYSLLNCGFRMRPSAGTASGVHPVSLGFGRVYVHQPNGFDYDDWIKGLDEGRSFITTGPMLTTQVNGKPTGVTYSLASNASPTCHLTGSATSETGLDRIEIVVNGEVVQTLAPQNKPTPSGAFMTEIDTRLNLKSSSWVAVRCFENRDNKRIRFAHSAPTYFDIEGKLIRPKREEVQYFIDRMNEEIERCRGVITQESLAEYEKALAIYTEILQRATQKVESGTRD